MVSKAPDFLTVGQTQLHVPRPATHAWSGVWRALWHFDVVHNPVALTCSLIRQLPRAEREQRAGHTKHDVSHRAATWYLHLRGLVAHACEYPLEASTSHLGERFLIGRQRRL
eukprot:4171202-Prymnesium_polylepis.1